MGSALPKYLCITQNSGTSIADFLSNNSYSQLFVLMDENTRQHCLPELSNYIGAFNEIEIKSGEINKTLETCTIIWSALTDANADRNALLINVGGGVIGDMGGFCASTYKRGIDFINIPTTLLSQVDASIGGKLGVDFGGYKNHIGLFRLPAKVIIDSNFLSTLPTKEIRSGFAEMLKHGFIRDTDYLDQLTNLNLENCNWEQLIGKSIHIKSEIVESDPYETGNRKLLNFGHTVGHAIETHFLTSEKPLLHGEAIAIGMIAEAFLSSKLGELPKEELNVLVQLVDSYFERVNIPESAFDEILNNIEQDKKNMGTSIQAVLLKSLGCGQYSFTLTKEDVIDSLKFYNLK